MDDNCDLPLTFPEVIFKKNVSVNKRKAVFIADDGKIGVEEAISIAKDQAVKMGMGDRALLVVRDAPYNAKEKGWLCIVQSRF